jgi:hypothetical protein
MNDIANDAPQDEPQTVTAGPPVPGGTTVDGVPVTVPEEDEEE